MNQRRQQGQRRQQEQQGQQGHQEMGQNEAMSRSDAAKGLLATLNNKREEIAPILPPDLTFEAFHATINQAVRTNPDILDCEPRSLVNACVKGAYDGLRIDGREAAIVYDMMSPRGGGRKQKIARYMPMYQGLVQQVLRGGMVLSMEADVAFENDLFRIVGGTDRRIIHEPLLQGDRGKRIAAYNIATLPSGLRISHYLLAADILDIQKMSQSGWKDDAPAGVWARWPTEQWKKTVLRQHRKTLPVGLRPIRDMEAESEFPQFNPQPHPQIDTTPRPTRAAIADRRGTESGTFVDFGNFDRGQTVEHEHVEQERGEQAASQQQQQPQQDAKEQQQDPPTTELPHGDAEWQAWADDLEKQIDAAENEAVLDKIWAGSFDVRQHAPADLKSALQSAVTDRNADFALGED